MCGEYGQGAKCAHLYSAANINPHRVMPCVALATLRKWAARDAASEVDSWAAKSVRDWIVAVIKKEFCA
jgi:hypothetical protein